jgi:hypothetical protein
MENVANNVMLGIVASAKDKMTGYVQKSERCAFKPGKTT